MNSPALYLQAPHVTHPTSRESPRKLYSPPTSFLKGPFLLRRLAQNAPGIIWGNATDFHSTATHFNFTTSQYKTFSHKSIKSIKVMNLKKIYISCGTGSSRNPSHLKGIYKRTLFSSDVFPEKPFLLWRLAKNAPGINWRNATDFHFIQRQPISI